MDFDGEGGNNISGGHGKVDGTSNSCESLLCETAAKSRMRGRRLSRGGCVPISIGQNEPRLEGTTSAVDVVE